MKGIIDWKSISNIKIGETVYKTLFSSCYFMRMSIHNEFTEKVDIMNKRSNNNGNNIKISTNNFITKSSK